MSTYALVIHGGAVTMKPGQLSPEEEAAQREGLAQALQAGWEVLHRGGPALDAVEAGAASKPTSISTPGGAAASPSRARSRWTPPL